MTNSQATRRTAEWEIDASDHVQGPPDAPITLLEYGDFQCPHCGEAYPIVKQIQQTLGNSLRLVYRHFPLMNIHPFAEIAAEAAEAAGAQNRFWEMHDYLFEHQYSLSPQLLRAGAEALHLDLVRFANEVDNRVYAERVQRDLISGRALGVFGTPTFFINGVRHEGSYDFDSMMEAIRDLRRGRAA